MSGFNFTSVRVQFVALEVSITQGFRVFPVSSTSSTLLLVYPYRTVSHTSQLTALLNDALQKIMKEYGLKEEG